MTKIRETILTGTRTNSSLELAITSRATKDDMEDFYKDMNELYDEPKFSKLPNTFYAP